MLKEKREEVVATGDEVESHKREILAEQQELADKQMALSTQAQQLGSAQRTVVQASQAERGLAPRMQNLEGTKGRQTMQTTEQETRPPEARASRPDQLNGIDRKALFATIEAVKADPAKASCKFSATTRWQGGTVSNTEIAKYELGGQVIPQSYAIAIDEPNALLGTDTAPNPQMVLFAALNACVLNTFVINAAAKGIRIDHVELDLDGELDLRGFLGIDDATNPGYNELTMVCRVRGDGTQAQYEECLEAGTRYSPNFQSISRPVKVTYRVQTA